MLTSRQFASSDLSHAAFSPSLTVGAILERGVSLTHSRVQGVFALVALGDALGLPVETWSAKRIAEKFPDGIRALYSLEGNPFLKNEPRGIYSDDTQLGIAVSKGILSGSQVSIAAIARAHIEAAGVTTRGWGKTTCTAVQRLAQGIPVEESGKAEHPNHGKGNGVLMKIFPLGLWAVSTPKRKENEVIEVVHKVARMTHATPVAAASAVGQVYAMIYCLGTDQVSWTKEGFLFAVEEGVKKSLSYFPESEDGALLLSRTQAIMQVIGQPCNVIIEENGCGSTKACDSAPFSWAFFARAGGTIQAVFDVIEAGGDTDSNGAIVGALVGARFGSEAIPHALFAEINGVTNVLFAARELAARLCD